jgi:hypothetical protein
MTDFVVVKTEVRPNRSLRVWRRSEDDGSLHTNSFHPDAMAGRGAEYGLTDPVEILDHILHEAFAPPVGSSPLDDPAAAGGWVTTADPDSEPIQLYNARSTRDALGAHRARIAGSGHRVLDPDGLLTQFAARVPVDEGLKRAHREWVDVTRWHMIYGDLPDAPEGGDRA